VSASVVDGDTTRVTFGKDVGACSFTATESGGTPSGDAIATAAAGQSVDVSFENARQAFHLQVVC
jgi:hypothetical protein